MIHQHGNKIVKCLLEYFVIYKYAVFSEKYILCIIQYVLTSTSSTNVSISSFSSRISATFGSET